MGGGVGGQGDPIKHPAGFFGIEVGLASPSHASILRGIRRFAPRVAAEFQKQPLSLAGPGTTHTLPTQLTVASLGFPAMSSRWPHGPCRLPKGPADCLRRKGSLGWCHKAMGSMDPLSLYIKSVVD